MNTHASDNGGLQRTSDHWDEWQRSRPAERLGVGFLHNAVLEEAVGLERQLMAQGRLGSDFRFMVARPRRWSRWLKALGRAATGR